VIDALLIIIPPIFGVPFRESFLMAMTLLVAASPCALALGTPSAILASIARAAQSGVLIKGGAHLENLGNLQVIAFDKTGTLTQGTPKVTEVIPHPPASDDDVLSIAAAVESHSAHPLALAIVSAAKAKNIDIPDVRSVRAETGVGIEAEVEGGKVCVRKIDSDSKTSNLPRSIQEAARSLESQGKTVVQVSIDSTLLGIIALSDSIREEAPKTIRALRELGIEKIIMLSGDNERAAFHIGKLLELDQVKAELMPEEKLRVIDELTRGNTNVAMVGDGVNDAPALAAASTGIAMGGAKTHVALETSDVVLMADDLSGLPFAIELSKRTRSIIRQNFVLALGVIIGLITLTLTNVAGITLAIALHEGSTLLVVFNALRLLRFRPVKAAA
jgi:Cd2+/Zn2+-exporting ATPase